MIHLPTQMIGTL